MHQYHSILAFTLLLLCLNSQAMERRPERQLADRKKLAATNQSQRHTSQAAWLLQRLACHPVIPLAIAASLIPAATAFTLRDIRDLDTEVVAQFKRMNSALYQLADGSVRLGAEFLQATGEFCYGWCSRYAENGVGPCIGTCLNSIAELATTTMQNRTTASTH